MSISILPMRLQLLTLPRENLSMVMSAVVRNLYYRKNDAFFSLTENALEVSIVADVESVSRDFPTPAQCPGLAICPDPFRALQIDNDAAYGMDHSAKRINEISAPLAKAGVSIFYLSTYQTDYVFVKERRMPLVVSTLQASEFDFIDLDEFEMIASPVNTLNPYITVTTSHMPRDFTSSVPSSATTSEPIPDLSSSPLRPEERALATQNLYNGRFLAQKVVLPQTLGLVGLNREYIDTWIMTVVKIIFYTDLLRATRPTNDHRTANPDSAAVCNRFFSYTATEDGISVVADDTVLSEFPEHYVNKSTTTEPLKCIQIDLSDYGLDKYGIVYSMADPLAKEDINLLYLSTYTTANVLVDAKNVPRAMQILDDVVKRQSVEH
ncbi:hypothetical protein BC832DRAFT_546898 [Gaertneriomyces semiglobifer]|nr:hypothetical protein BC832DRAFT_546898 [Gaertneriomyces semiglobifer]